MHLEEDQVLDEAAAGANDVARTEARDENEADLAEAIASLAVGLGPLQG